MRRAIAALAAVAALNGCSGSGGDETTTAALGPTGARMRVNDDGRHFGYIRDIHLDARTIEFDRAELLTGARASAAARADGVIARGEVVPNDYYIRNPDHSFRALALAPSVSVTTAPCDPTCRHRAPGSLRGLAQSFHVPETLTLAHPYRGTQSQYWLTLRKGKVVAIDEQYLP